MNLQARIEAFAKLGDFFNSEIFIQHEKKLELVSLHNPWFTQQSITSALNAWKEQLQFDMLNAWLNPYKLKEPKVQKRVLVIMAGNIPLVGFHDFLVTLISGHQIVIKMSSSDNILLSLIINKLLIIAPEFKKDIKLIDDIKNKSFDVIIATGSDNSAQYFEYYFKESKKLIRKNRTSIALLDGSETGEDLEGLSNDVFAYFGLGCRNVSKLFLPRGYDLDCLFKAFYPFSWVIEHKKYASNYEYNKAVFLMGNNKLIENGFLLMKEEKSLFSPIAVLYYEYYDDISLIENFIKENSRQLQCVVSKKDISFGDAQRPNLWDYADGVDTIEFLRSL